MTDFVIGGYSSLLQIFNFVGCNIFLWKYENHHNPELFEKFAKMFGRENQLKKYFKLKKSDLNLDFSRNIKKEYNTIIKTISNN